MNKIAQSKMISEYQGEIIHNMFKMNNFCYWLDREKDVMLMARETKN